MKKVVLLSAVAFALIFSACGNSSTTKGSTETFDTTKLKTGETFYQCEMHPEVVSDKAGTCPKCGMDLVKIEKK
jgi:hypothetical protein